MVSTTHLNVQVQCEDEVNFKNWPWGEYKCNIKVGLYHIIYCLLGLHKCDFGEKCPQVN